MGTVLSDVPLFQDNSRFRASSNASTGRAEHERLGFSECEPQANGHKEGTCQGTSPSSHDSLQKVLIQSYDKIPMLKSFLIAPNLFPICSACLYLIREMKPFDF